MKTEERMAVQKVAERRPQEKIERQVAGYLRYCERMRRMSPATIVMKRNILKRFVRVTGVKSMEEVTNRVFSRWMGYCNASGASARTINSYNTVILTMVRYFREDKVRVPLNLARVARLKEEAARRKFYSAEEIEKVVRACAGAFTSELMGERVGLIITVMFETGMRIAEVTRLRLCEIEGQQICFIGKGRKAREVYVTRRTGALIAEYVERAGVRDYLWGNSAAGNGQPPSTVTVRKWLARAFKVAGMEGFYPHALRHSFATDLQKRGASVAEIKEMMGHSNIATTERYLHGFDGQMRELFEKYR